MHLYALDANISRIRRDYDVIDSDNLHEEMSDESDHIEDFEDESNEIQPEGQHVEEAKDEPGAKFKDLIKTGNSNEGEGDANKSDSWSIEEIDDEDYNPSFLSYAAGDSGMSENNKMISNSWEKVEKSEEKLKDSKIEYIPSQSSEFQEINFWLDELNLEENHQQILNKKQISHPLANKNEVELEGSAFDEPEVKEEILVNNQRFENNFFNKKFEEDKAEMYYPVAEIKKEKKINPKHRQNKWSVYEPVFATKIHQLAGNEIPNEPLFKHFASQIKMSFVGMTEEEADKLMRIDETYPELSNQDVVLAKPGSVIKKCWRLKNLGTKQWPKDTRIVSVTDNLLFVPPRIIDHLKPGEMMDVGINIYIPESELGENNLKEYIMRLFCDELKCFGEPIIITCHIDTQLFDDTMSNQNEEDTDVPRVASEGPFVENYEIAKELYHTRKECFAKIVYDLQKAELYKNSV